MFTHDGSLDICTFELVVLVVACLGRDGDLLGAEVVVDDAVPHAYL